MEIYRFENEKFSDFDDLTFFDPYLSDNSSLVSPSSVIDESINLPELNIKKRKIIISRFIK